MLYQTFNLEMRMEYCSLFDSLRDINFIIFVILKMRALILLFLCLCMCFIYLLISSALSLFIYLCVAGALGTAIPIKVHPSPVATGEAGIIYEAEKAFANVKEVECYLGILAIYSSLLSILISLLFVLTSVVSGDVEMSGGAGVTMSSSSYVIFTVNIPEDGVYSVFLHAYSCGEQV